MNPNNSLYRKLIYVGLILALFLGMWPYKRMVLDPAKQQSDLGEATIGQVDAGTFTLNLALLGGARGIAANMLWMNAKELQKAQEYDKLSATVDLITKLQPHFLAIWTYQGWNLAYNVSVEWDAPDDKYEWIKRGIKFEKKGVEKNVRSPDLHWDVAWIYYHKLGFSDEAIYLRRLFHEDPDEDFHRYLDPKDDTPSPIYDDNFQLARGWFQRAMARVDRDQEEVRSDITKKLQLEYVDAPEQHKGKDGDLAFRSMAAHAGTKYAIYLEKESKLGIPPIFSERAKEAWRTALGDWQVFGDHEWEAFNDPDHNKVYLDDYMNEEKFKTLPETRRYWTERWATQMNYPYWKDRCIAEMSDEGIQARRFFHEGRKALKEADFPKSVGAYTQGLALWKSLLDKHKYYREDQLNQQDTGLIVNYYIRALKQMNEEVPPDAPFLELGKKYEKEKSVDPFDVLEVIPSSVYQQIKKKFERPVNN